jgi:hypothetical protein
MFLALCPQRSSCWKEALPLLQETAAIAPINVFRRATHQALDCEETAAVSGQDISIHAHSAEALLAVPATTRRT